MALVSVVFATFFLERQKNLCCATNLKEAGNRRNIKIPTQNTFVPQYSLFNFFSRLDAAACVSQSLPFRRRHKCLDFLTIM